MPDDAPAADLDTRLAAAMQSIEGHLLGESPSLTRLQVAEESGVPMEVAVELWRFLGFPQSADDDVAFTHADVEALRLSHDLMKLGILSPDRQAALVRTWGRSFARLAEWQTTLLADVAFESDDPASQLTVLAEQVLPKVESLQSYVWRRHLASAASRMMAIETAGSPATRLAVAFVDIVGFTSRSKEMGETELVQWIEYFEAECSGIVVDHGGRVIKNIGDEVLFVSEDVEGAAETALVMTERGQDERDEFPSVRGGLAYGDVVARLGDVFGPTVNIASRLTSVARPSTVLVDDGAQEALAPSEGAHGPFDLRRIRRTPVKGYSKLQPWALRRSSSRSG